VPVLVVFVVAVVAFNSFEDETKYLVNFKFLVIYTFNSFEDETNGGP